RSDDAYSPDGRPELRPDRAVIVYAQRCREAFKDVPIVLGGIEASLRRIAHFDYWSEKVRRSVLLDAKADLLVFGNGERPIAEIARRLRDGETMATLTDVRGTAFARRKGELRAGFVEIDSTTIDVPGVVTPPPNPYAEESARAGAPCDTGASAPAPLVQLSVRRDRGQTVVRMPAFEEVVSDPVLYAHASRLLHLEANPGNARALVQAHGDRDVWLNPPALPLTSAEMDGVYELPYARRPHPAYGAAKIPAYEMIKTSVTITRGCFGGCTFCSITEHEGRIIQNRSEASVLREIERVRDQTPGFTGVISDLGGPTANMYRLACKSPEVEAACRLPSCVYPGICENLNTNHDSLVALYRKARAVKGVKRVFIASGVRYDLAAESPAYVRELATHHVGGYLKIAPEHTEDGPLSMMLKPGIGTYEKFRALFDRFSREAGKKQYLIPYFIAAHPGTRDEDMVALALWLKRNGFKADQVQAFLPSPMATATAMYHTGINPLKKLRREALQEVAVPKGLKQRRLHKAFLRYHDPENWPLLREALIRLGRTDLIGPGAHQLIPHEGARVAGAGRGGAVAGGGRPEGTKFRTQHTRPASGPARGNQRGGKRR
ncbi:MAG TPA: YgiQ family radical SAM protein, partial [Polyangia bacterium]